MTTPWPFVVIIGILGLAIGSFLNVVIYRVP
ncbi:MAG: prepilin peptidase, partial [Jatrophihabitans endophyticus]|nr:prepilin peptidase [Jatrophihabitans endophyticus]